MSIIAGGSRCNSRYFTWHLQRTDSGQTVEVLDAVGLVGNRMRGWFDQIEAIASGGDATNAFYHFSISPRPGEAFTPEQVNVAVATALKNLGLEDQPFFVVRHGGKDGRPDHYHCIASRVDLDTGKAISDSHNYAIHMKTADELEKLFDHERTRRGHGPEGPNPKNYEVQRARETGISPKEMKGELTALWRTADTGQAFAAALEEHGYILAKGDRRDFVIVDLAGHDHSLTRRIEGAKAADIRTRMADVDRDALPSVGEARALARSRAEDGYERVDDASLPAPAPKRAPAALDVQAEEPLPVATDAIVEMAPLPSPDAPEAEPSSFAQTVRNVLTVAEEAVPLLMAASGELSPPEATREVIAFGAHVEEYLRHRQAAGVLPSERSAGEMAPSPQADTGDVPAERSTEETARSQQRGAASSSGREPEPLDLFEENIRRFVRDAVSRDMQISATPSREPPPTQQLEPLERYERDIKRAMRARGGQLFSEDAVSLWRRSVAVLEGVRHQVSSLVKDTWRDVVRKLSRDRHSPPDDHDHGRER